ncbi:hypothetical protein QUF80_07085 [Desulfococcaceae bacterium HSG8]|nr:hypothetical protein [Desulfococcaceae bacterium HSG8]
MLTETKIKDTLLLGSLYLLIALAWLSGWFFLGMRWEFLSAPLMFAVILGCHRFSERASGIIIGGSVGAVYSVLSVGIIPGLSATVMGTLAGLAVGELAWEFEKMIDEGTVEGKALGKVLRKLGEEPLTKNAGDEVVLRIIMLALAFVVIIFLLPGWIAKIAFLSAIPGSLILFLMLVRGSSFITYIRKTYSVFINPHIRLSAFLLLPPFILFLSLYVLRIADYSDTSLSLYISPIIMGYTGVIAALLFIVFTRPYNGFFLPFRHASQNEKERWHYLSAYPRLFCQNHLMKPCKVRRSLFYYDIRCRAKDCPQEFLAGVRKVAGLIGGNAGDYRRDGDRIYINLWSESEKKAGNADIDVLEIRDTAGINYDYAINAVLVSLKNDASRPAGYVRQIPVVIYENPPIPEGAMRILEHEFGEIRHGKE